MILNLHNVNASDYAKGTSLPLQLRVLYCGKKNGSRGEQNQESDLRVLESWEQRKPKEEKACCLEIVKATIYVA